MQYQTSAKITELVAAVQKAFKDYSPSKANRIFLTLHGCMKEILKVRGGNNYNIPHIRKKMLEGQASCCSPWMRTWWNIEDLDDVLKADALGGTQDLADAFKAVDSN